MQTPAEIMVALAAGLMLFIGLLRYVVSFMKGYEKRRLELFEKYEATLTENIQLKGKLDTTTFQSDQYKAHARYYYKELLRYKRLYEQVTLDKLDKKD